MLKTDYPLGKLRPPDTGSERTRAVSGLMTGHIYRTVLAVTLCIMVLISLKSVTTGVIVLQKQNKTTNSQHQWNHFINKRNPWGSDKSTKYNFFPPVG